jgi:hypothetical protein
MQFFTRSEANSRPHSPQVKKNWARLAHIERLKGAVGLGGLHLGS